MKLHFPCVLFIKKKKKKLFLITKGQILKPVTQKHPTQQTTDQEKFEEQTLGRPVSYLNLINCFWQQIKTVVSCLWAVFNGVLVF